MKIPTRKEIGRFSHGYMTGLMVSSFVMLVTSICVSMGWPWFMMYVSTVGVAAGCFLIYGLALADKDDIAAEIAMYYGAEK